jgi:hypothetical protein
MFAAIFVIGLVPLAFYFRNLKGGPMTARS